MLLPGRPQGTAKVFASHATHVGDPEGVPGPWLQPSTVANVMDIWEPTNEWEIFLSASLSIFEVNNFLKSKCFFC